MAKPKAPRWLTQAFADGVDELVPPLSERHGAYPGAWAHCFLAHHDPARHPCEGQTGTYERFHFIPRQRVENALGALLPDDGQPFMETAEVWDPSTTPAEEAPYFIFRGRADLILIAAWDPRNGDLGCEHHHRRFDGHATSPRAPKIIVPWDFLPDHVDEFVVDYGLDGPASERFPMLP